MERTMPRWLAGLLAAWTLAVPATAQEAGKRQLPVHVTGEVRAGGTTLRVTITNGLPGPIAFHGYGTRPTDWNAETASVSLVDVYREGTPGNLFLAAPKVEPPLKIAGRSRVTIPPGKSLTVETDARKWSIRGGWTPGRYRATVRVDHLELDEFSTASVRSEPFEFVVTAGTPSRPSGTARLAARWLEKVGPEFFLGLGSTAVPPVTFTTDEKRVKSARPNEAVFLISRRDAASLVQTLVDSGLWSRRDPIPLGPSAGRFLRVGPEVVEDGVNLGGGVSWWLGADEDDVSSLFIIRRLREISQGEQRAALERWLRAGQK